MHSRTHALLSAVLALVVVLAVPTPVHPAVVVAVVLVVGVGIDLDHFVLAFANAGTTAPVRRVLRRPSIAFADQEAIFDDEDLTPSQRLLSHAILGGVAVGALWLVAPYWSLVVAVTVYVHVLADLYGDVTSQEGPR